MKSGQFGELCWERAKIIFPSGCKFTQEDNMTEKVKHHTVEESKWQK